MAGRKLGPAQGGHGAWLMAVQISRTYRGTNMKRILALLPLLFLVTTGADAAPQSAKEYLTAIYSHYRGDDRTAKGIFLDKPSDIRRYFTKDLSDLMIADDAVANKNGDVPSLDGDPFIDAQDWQITHLVIHIDSETEKAARATVTFENSKEPQTVHVELVRTADGWRFSDIIWKEGSLRGLYKKK